MTSSLRVSSGLRGVDEMCKHKRSTASRAYPLNVCDDYVHLRRHSLQDNGQNPYNATSGGEGAYSSGSLLAGDMTVAQS